MGLAVLAGFAGYTAIEKVQDLVPVVVATQTIEPHQQITQNMVKTVEVPALGRADNVVDDPSLVVGGYSTSRIFANQTIIQPMVAKQFDETGASGLALSIPKEDLRAISFPTDNANCVNGQVKKGDHVDIIVTLHSDVVAAVRIRQSPKQSCKTSKSLEQAAGATVETMDRRIFQVSRSF